MCAEWMDTTMMCMQLYTSFSEFVGDYANSVFDVLMEEYTANDGEEPGYEWEGYDGWYNNPAHPDWGGAGNVYNFLQLVFCSRCAVYCCAAPNLESAKRMCDLASINQPYAAKV